MTIEELLARDPDSLNDEEVAFLKHQSQLHFTYEKGVKLVLNSIYGAFGNEFFHFFNVNIAETITMQGQEAIKYTEKMVNAYFSEFFHKDKQALAALNVPEGAQVPRVAKPAFLYCDTDSGYITFQYAMEAAGWTGSAKDFVLTLDKVRLHEYFKTILAKYAAGYGVESYLDFELETISENAVLAGKKRYIQNIVWKDGKHFEPLTYIKSTGLDIVQSSTPVFCRERLTELMKFIFSKKAPTIEAYGELVKLIKKIKKEFELAGVERTSKTSSVSDYQKYVADDQASLTVLPKCPIHVRAAAHHNHKIHQAPKYKTRYQLLKSKDKIKWYYAVDPACDVFAYKGGAYPVEFAPRMDVEKQFKLTMLEPLNRIIVPAGYQALNPSLAYTVGLF